jgi:Flp pilus assembly pilin Flp
LLAFLSVGRVLDVAALIAMVIIGAVSVLGANLSNNFNTVATMLK